MWLFTPHAFLSVVAHRTKPRHVLVRARLAGHIQAVFPGAKVVRTPDADYLFRATVTRRAFEKALVEVAREVDYPNFKNSIHDPELRDFAGATWDAGMQAQLDAQPGSGGQYGRLFELQFAEGGAFGTEADDADGQEPGGRG